MRLTASATCSAPAWITARMRTIWCVSTSAPWGVSVDCRPGSSLHSPVGAGPFSGCGW